MHRLAVFTVAFAAALLAACQASPGDESSHEVASAAVRVTKPKQGVLPRTVVAWGEASTGPAYQRAVTFGADGALASLTVGLGEHVHAGQVIGTFALSPTATAARNQATTALAVATQALARSQRLHQDALATNDDVAQAEKAVADARANLATFPATTHGGAVPLRAPADGTVTSIAASVGQGVPANGTLLTITPSSGLVFAGGLEPRDAMSVRNAMPVALLPVGGGEAMHGTVSGIGDAIDAQTRLVPVRIQPDHAVLAGSAWRAEITVGQAAGWLMPADAVVDDTQGRAVYQVHDGKAARVVVHVLLERGDQVVLDGVIDPTAPIVTVGAPQLTAGMAVVTAEGSR